MQTNFGQVITAMVTPFDEKDPSRIDHQATAKLAQYLAQNGSDSIIVSGTTGESPTLSHQEEAELFTTVKQSITQTNNQTKIIFGAGSNSTKTSIKMSFEAQKLGADGLLIVTPYYNKPNQKGLLEHYSQIASQTSLPIILYNVPSRTNISLEAETIIELNKRHPHISALKEASSNMDLISELRLKLDPASFNIYCGDDSLTLSQLAVGADGVISVASHLAGLKMQEMISAFKEGRLSLAKEIHYKLFPLFNYLFIEPNPTCIKAALGIKQLCSSKLRAPLVELSLEQKEKLKEIINSLEKIAN